MYFTNLKLNHEFSNSTLETLISKENDLFFGTSNHVLKFVGKFFFCNLTKTNKPTKMLNNHRSYFFFDTLVVLDSTPVKVTEFFLT